MTALYQWATVADVTAVTGVVLPDATTATPPTSVTLNLAKQSIELITGAIESVPRQYLSRRDYYWLRLASCYQAVWLLDQPDYLTRLDARMIVQDGAQIEGNPDWLRLAPAASSAIKKLSWKGTRTLAPVRPYSASHDLRNPFAGNTTPLPEYVGLDPHPEGSDEYETWTPEG